MDKLFVRKDVYEELIEKGFGKKDYSKLTKKVITDKNGHKRTVFVKNDVEQTEQKQPKAQEGLTPEKKARYEEMLEKVKAGSDENALFVRGKMLNKKDAIAYLEGKLGKKSSISLREQTPSIREKEESLTVNEADKFYGNYDLKKVGESVDRKGWTVKEYKNNAGETWIGKFNKEGKYVGSEYNPESAKKNSSAEGHLESDTPQNTDITKEDEERFGKQALSGLSGKRTAEPKHTLEVGSEVKFKRTGQPIKIKKFEQYGDTKVVVGEYDYKGKKEENRFRLDELDYEEEKPEQKKDNNPIAIGNTVKFKRTGQPIKIKDIETYGNDKVIVGEYEHNGKTETNRFRMDEISTEPTQDDMKENYLDAKNEGGKDIADENRIDTHSKNAINLNDSEVKKMQKVFDYIPENATASQIMNTIYDEDKALYKKLSEMDIEYKKLHPEAEGKTFGFDLAAKYLEDSFNEYKKDHEVGKDKFAEMSVEDIRKEQQNLLDDYNQYYNAYKNGKNDGSKLREYFKKFDVYKTALDKKSKK